MRWRWDPNKAAANRVKHGLSFEIAALDTWPEAESKQGELVGRIISARKATVHESKAYEEGNFQAIDP